MAGYQVDDKLVDDHLAVQAIIRSYQVKKSWMWNEMDEWMNLRYKTNIMKALIGFKWNESMEEKKIGMIIHKCMNLSF